jgi:hypothetical protein
MKAYGGPPTKDRAKASPGLPSYGAIPVNTSAPSEARKRGSGGGSPRKYDDLLTGSSEASSGGDPHTKDRAKANPG